MSTPRTDAERADSLVHKLEDAEERISQLERELEEARKHTKTCQSCHSIGVQLDLIRDELKRIEARILESGLSEDPRLSNILEYCRRSQRDIATFYSVIGERDRLEAENLKLRIKVEDQRAALEATKNESEDRNQQWAAKSIYASQLEQEMANINSQLTAAKSALEKAKEQFIWMVDNCQWCGGSGRDNDGEAELNKGCPRCTRFGEALTAIDSVLKGANETKSPV